MGALAELAPRAARAEGPAESAPAAGPTPAPVEEPPYEPERHGGWAEGAWLRATHATERRSVGMMVTGISLLVIGTTLVATGAGVGITGSTCSGQTVILADGSTRTLCGPMPGKTVGSALGIAGLASIGIGIPLTVLGSAEVRPVEPACAPRPTLLLGLRSVAFEIKF